MMRPGRSAFLLLAIFITSALTSCDATMASQGKTIYLVQVDDRRWCGFSEEPAWRSEVESLSASVVATAEYVDDKLSTVKVTETDDSADWVVFDVYAVNRAAQLSTLNRTINVIPGQRSERQVFSISGTKVTRVGSTSLDLTTGEVLRNPADIWLPSIPIISSVDKFPFAEIILVKKNAVWSEGKVCTQAGGSK